MSVVDLTTRKPVTEQPKAPTLVNSLKTVIARIEDGSLDVDGFYVIAQCTDGARHSFDNGLSGEQAITMLEREKFAILCMLEGVKL